nr:MBOAT family O-acyltransferase [uncultured Rhodopila sp.]
MAVNLAALGFFKYAGFIAGNAARALHVPGNDFFNHIALPIGISFYTFEAISYNVDVYRRTIEARTKLFDFALFISFFPHLVAGPIIRPAHFFPQLAGRTIPSAEDMTWGATQIIKGLIKKTVYADNFAVIANAYFNGPIGHAGMGAAWVGTVAFSMQIYFDFAGYTDIARGCARLLGYSFPPNFERPYLAADIAEFWRRWHISLSTWLRDYLYIPLGGNRRGAARTYVNLLITMGLGGLWHGASWNFLVWGVYHGLLLAGHRLWRQSPAAGVLERGAGRALGVAATFLMVTLGWVTFRAPDFTTTIQVLGELFDGSMTGPGAAPVSFWVLLGTSAAWTALDRDRRLQTWLANGSGVSGALRASTALASAFVVLELFSRTDVSIPFIYFQF